ncbi:hypothetical protein D3C77_242340 [compost metagenome]
MSEQLGVDGQLFEPAVHDFVAAVEMLGQPQEMQVGAVVEHGGAGSDTDGTAEVAHQVEQTRCQLQTLRGQGAEGEGDDRRNRHLLGKTADCLR